MTTYRRAHLLPALLLAGLLAACGGQAVGPAATAAPTAPATAAPTAPATAAPPAAPTQPAPATAAPDLAGAPTSGAAGPFAGIPQGRTAEGYQALGAADAPVTLVMYSDFL